MTKSLLKKLPAILLCFILCLGVAVFAVACGGGQTDDDQTHNDEQTDDDQTNNDDNTDDDQTHNDDNTDDDQTHNDDNTDDDSSDAMKKYYFEAEYVDLTDVTSDRGSGNTSGKDLIVKGDRAHNGYYVQGFNIKDSTLTYTIHSDAAATVQLSLLICGENAAGTLDSELLIIKVNGTAVTYSDVAVKNDKEKVSAIKTNLLFDEVSIGDIQLNKGDNTITLTVGEKVGTSNNYTYGINVDALVLTSSSPLTWNPIDPDEFYPDY